MYTCMGLARALWTESSSILIRFVVVPFSFIRSKLGAMFYAIRIDMIRQFAVVRFSFIRSKVRVMLIYAIRIDMAGHN